MSRLRDLADAADRHAEHRELTDTPEAESVLSDLAPDMARLLADMGDALELMLDLSARLYRDPDKVTYEEKRLRDDNARVMLARLRELEAKA